MKFQQLIGLTLGVVSFIIAILALINFSFGATEYMFNAISLFIFGFLYLVTALKDNFYLKIAQVGLVFITGIFGIIFDINSIIGILAIVVSIFLCYCYKIIPTVILPYVTTSLITLIFAVIITIIGNTNIKSIISVIAYCFFGAGLMVILVLIRKKDV